MPGTRRIQIENLQKRWLIPLVSLVIALLTASSVVSYQYALKHNDYSSWTTHTDIVIENIQQTLIDLVDAETSQRGYLLTHDASFLKPYDRAKLDIDKSLQALETLTADNPAQQELLAKIAPLKTDLFRRYEFTIRQGHSLKLSDAKADMDMLRNYVGSMEQNEKHLRLVRIEREEESFRRLCGLNLATILMSLGTVVIFTSLLRTNARLANETENRLVGEREKALEVARLKNSFLANMSHEIRTPMNGIIGMVDLLRDTPLNEQQEKFVQVLRESSATLLALINSILDLSKIESGHLALESVPTDLQSLVRSVYSSFEYQAHAKGLRFTLDFDHKIPEYVSSDPLRLRQILTNLVGNAIKFTERGEVRLQVRAMTDGNATAARVRFEIQDSGIGIPALVLPKLFQQFTQADASTTRKYGGTGLGLTISKLLTEKMGGSMDVESAEGKGSTFWFEMPFYTVVKLDTQTASHHQAKSFQKEYQVLLVEDNLINQNVIGSMLKKMGMKTTFAENGEKALEVFRNQDFDLVIMDCHMPVMDGYEATRHIRKDFPAPKNQVPILASTANAVQGDREKCIEAGMNDYISKPILFDQLVHKLKTLLS